MCEESKGGWEERKQHGEERKQNGEYWEGAEGLLRRATAHVYRSIISPAAEGGLKEFLDDNCEAFAGSKKGDEHSPRHWDLYRAFEAHVGAAIEDFVDKEFPDDRQERVRQVQDALRRGCDAPDTKTSAAVAMLVAAADFHKFCAIMRQRARDRAKRRAHEAKQQDD